VLYLATFSVFGSRCVSSAIDEYIGQKEKLVDEGHSSENQVMKTGLCRME